MKQKIICVESCSVGGQPQFCLNLSVCIEIGRAFHEDVQANCGSDMHVGDESSEKTQIERPKVVCFSSLLDTP